jgi:sialic acid synthase SpsE
MSKLLDLFSNYNSENYEIIEPYVIAEAGVNHEGSMELAKRLIDEAKDGGADAIKFQTYKADTIASTNSPSYWDLSKEPTTSQHELFKKYDKFWVDEFYQLKDYCDKVDIEFMSTPFDVESAIFLNKLMNVFKISSSDITNKPFIEFMCDFGKPIILSTGASTIDEIKEAVSWINAKGNKLALLHCILNYPTKDENANLGMIKGLQYEFPKNIIGYSDHTLPKNMKSLEWATLLGAKILEKHFTHDKSLPGNDHYHAMDKIDLKLFKTNINNLMTSLGEFKVCALDSEELAIKNARRSLVAKNKIRKNQIIKVEDLTWKRPAFGISPKDIDNVVGKTSNSLIEEDDILYWNLLN